MTRKWIDPDDYHESAERWDRGGCYAFFGDGVVVYVGSSQRILGRVSAYFVGSSLLWRDGRWETPWGIFRSLAVKLRPDRFYGEYGTLELRLIRRLMPRGNRRGTKPAKHYTTPPLPAQLLRAS